MEAGTRSTLKRLQVGHALPADKAPDAGRMYSASRDGRAGPLFITVAFSYASGFIALGSR